LFSMGTAEGSAGLGGVRLLGRLVGRLFGRNAVALAKPAAEVDRLAARAAKRKLRPFRQALPFHRATAYRAGHPNHRPDPLRTWSFLTHPSCPFPHFPSWPCR